MTTSSVKIEVIGFQEVPAATPAFTSGVSVTTKFVRSRVQAGGDDDEYDAIRAVKTQVAAGGSVAFDFRTDTDRYGVALAADSMKVGYIANTNSSGSAQGTLQVAPGAANPWISFLNAAGTLTLPYESGVAFWCMRTGGWVIDATNKTLDIDETTTTDPADLEAQFWVTR